VTAEPDYNPANPLIAKALWRRIAPLRSRRMTPSTHQPRLTSWPSTLARKYSIQYPL
jgi:hypothetical protein